ncbi:hypothetical protein [Bacillus sp. UMB0728]|uniref:hypothetical protein n=1 Tax=Bacillus sp. UMB0728 TaxID=2066052 RepID=UPI000C76D724|nr:hypothetical protein [Bacillus sp. UMB0728]PLR70137.1 hypothetical protein CYJ37_25800 [Bacillus sp. UMB0728]
MEHALEAANRYKRHSEHLKKWSYYYPDEGNKIWCINYSKHNENTGFFVYSEKPVDYLTLKNAFWHLAMSSSLINGITKDMNEHYNKSLVFLTDLEKLLHRLKSKDKEFEKIFSSHLNEYSQMVRHYEDGKAETKRLNRNLISIEKAIMQKGELTDQDTEAILLNCAEYNLLKYTELHKQKATLRGIGEIDKWLKKNKGKGSFFSNTKKLIRYTDYFINSRSVGILEESLKDFNFYENKSEALVYDMDWNDGRSLFTERYVEEQRIIFEEEFIPMLRNPI